MISRGFGSQPFRECFIIVSSARGVTYVVLNQRRSVRNGPDFRNSSYWSASHVKYSFSVTDI